MINKNINEYLFELNGIKKLPGIINSKTKEFGFKNNIFIIIDKFFKNSVLFENEEIDNKVDLVYLDTTKEPTTESVDNLVASYSGKSSPDIVVGIGGGSVLDTAKACSNLFNNPGRAEDYQGWDLLKNRGKYKIGVPTISGTGAEASRTCVMTNNVSKIKLGMNSNFSVFDLLILDPNLTKTVERNQYFYTDMDSYVHCIESLSGNYRNYIGDTYSKKVIDLCREIFLSEDMMSLDNRSKLMIASYLGGCAIASSLVGIVHPLSAGLSVVLGVHHCEANCLVLNQLDEFYPEEVKLFKKMLTKQDIKLRENLTRGLTDEHFKMLYSSSIMHEKPLMNALGKNYKEVLSYSKVRKIFEKI